VGRERLVFAPELSARDAYLGRLQLADIFLDSRPYNAHTTARDALAVGVPVVTCSGRTFAARVAGSLLMSVGVPELVTSTPAAFEDCAVALALDAHMRERVVLRIAAGRSRSSAFDPTRQARQLEAAYAAMVARADAGQPPAPMAVAVDVG
jgi:predicted O-linked N-acetylglucosamine transferase (SPINDLY family)